LGARDASYDSALAVCESELDAIEDRPSAGQWTLPVCSIVFSLQYGQSAQIPACGLTGLTVSEVEATG
jgi:hypothetical protein